MSGPAYDNPYSQDSNNLQPETQSPDQIIRNAIQSAMLDVHTWLPCEVVKVRGDQKVDLQPLLQIRYKLTGLQTPPVIQNVMVAMPMGAGYAIRLPIAVGDTGVALFCERSLDVWKLQGGIVDPNDIRSHDVNDAIFIPGIVPFTEQTEGYGTDLVVQNGTAKLRVQKSGRFKVGNDANELFDTLVELVETLQDAMVLTGIGPEKFIASTQTQLSDVLTKLNSLKGA